MSLGDFEQPHTGRLFGVYVGVVTDVQDPDGQGRVRIRLPWIGQDDGTQATAWARLATMMAGNERGTWFIPEPGDEVLVSFIAGDPRHPVVTGALWNGRDTPPEQMDANNNVRTIKSRSGHVLRFNDEIGHEKVELETANGHALILDDAYGGTVTLKHQNGAQIEIDATGTVKITALSRVTVSAALLQVDAPASRFSGIVQCETLITNAVVSAAYTPGAGNVW